MSSLSSDQLSTDPSSLPFFLHAPREVDQDSLEVCLLKNLSPSYPRCYSLSCMDGQCSNPYIRAASFSHAVYSSSAALLSQGDHKPLSERWKAISHLFCYMSKPRQDHPFIGSLDKAKEYHIHCSLLSPKPNSLLWKEIMSALINPCWLSLANLFSFMCWEIDSLTICSISFLLIKISGPDSGAQFLLLNIQTNSSTDCVGLLPRVNRKVSYSGQKSCTDWAYSTETTIALSFLWTFRTR